LKTFINVFNTSILIGFKKKFEESAKHKKKEIYLKAMVEKIWKSIKKKLKLNNNLQTSFFLQLY